MSNHELETIMDFWLHGRLPPRDEKKVEVSLVFATFGLDLESMWNGLSPLPDKTKGFENYVILDADVKVKMEDDDYPMEQNDLEPPETGNGFDYAMEDLVEDVKEEPSVQTRHGGMRLNLAPKLDLESWIEISIMKLNSAHLDFGGFFSFEGKFS